MQQPFVRNQMLPQQKPPVTQTGAVKWVRENLFSSLFNTVLTLLGLYVVYWLIAASYPWLANGVWTAGSLGECREIIAAHGGTTGACWALIHERWNQFLFGFYLQDAYWRPLMALGMLFAALAPVLYYGLRRPTTWMVGVASALLVLALIGVQTDAWHVILVAVIMAGLTLVAWVAPKRLVYFTLLYPLVGFYLLWGGSVWGPVGVLAGLALMAGLWSLLQRAIGATPAAAASGLAGVLWFLWLQSQVTGALHDLMPIGLEPVDSAKFGGFLLSFVIGVTAIAGSLPIGILLALGRRSDMLLIKALSVGFIEFVRGVPLITMLFTASLLMQYFLPPQTQFDLILRVIILVTLFASAYIAEVIRGGLAALPRGQSEAAGALGLDYWQEQRLIIMPQALKIAIPGIVSSFIGLFKDTTLVALVGLADPLQGITKIVRADIAWKGVYWEPFIFVGAIFFVFCFGMSRYSMYLENKLKTDHR